MKKLMIALAIVAIASVAQAELLATWSGSNSGTVTAGDNAGVVVSDISSIGGAATTANTGDTWGMNTLTAAGAGLQFTITSITAGYNIQNAVMSGTISGSATGPGTMEWYVGASLVDSIVRTSITAVAFNNNLGTLESGDVVSLVSDGGTSVTGGVIGTGGSVRIRTGGVGGTMQLNGDVTSIPEPATMSLLGLGALAMVLRRKMKK